MTKPRLLDDASVELPPEPVVIQSRQSLDDIDLPVSTPMRVKPAVREEVLDASDGLDNLTQLALEKAKEIMNMPLIPGDEDFGTVLRQVGSTVATVLTTQARVDEGRFKKKQADKLGELLELMRTEEMKLIPGRVLN